MTGQEAGPGRSADEIEEEAEGQTLTPRQRRILSLLTAGKANKEIAYELGIGVGTVKQHLVALFRKLNVPNRTMAVARGRELVGRTVTEAPEGAGSGGDSLELRPVCVLSLQCTRLDPDAAGFDGTRSLAPVSGASPGGTPDAGASGRMPGLNMDGRMPDFGVAGPTPDSVPGGRPAEWDWTGDMVRVLSGSQRGEATLVVRGGGQVDVIFGLHRTREGVTGQAVALARTVYAEIAGAAPSAAGVSPAQSAAGAPLVQSAAPAPLVQSAVPAPAVPSAGTGARPSLRGAVVSGYVLASMARGGGWTGETVAGRLIGHARGLRERLPDNTLIVDVSAQRMRAFEARADHSPYGQRPVVRPELLALAGEEVSARAEPRARAPALVGRVAERAGLNDLVARLERGEGGWVWVEGEAGMGKTSLARAVGADAARHGVTFLEVRCGSQTHPPAAALERLLGSAREARRPAAAADVRDGVSPVPGSPPPLSPAAAALLAPAAAPLVFPAAAPPVSPAAAPLLSPAAAGGGTRRLKHHPGAPVLVLVDDCHDASPADIPILEVLAEATRHRPVAVIAAGRSARPSSLRAIEGPTIRLGRMDDGDIRTLARTVSGNRLTARDLDRVVETAAGVPLFSAELAWEFCHGAASGQEASGSRIPLSLALVSLVVSRIDALHLDRLLLKSVAWHGPVSASGLAHLLPPGRTGIEYELDRGVSAGVLERIGVTGTEQICVRHPLVRAVLRLVMPETPGFGL